MRAREAGRAGTPRGVPGAPRALRAWLIAALVIGVLAPALAMLPAPPARAADPLSCAPGTFYSNSGDGTLQRINPDGTVSGIGQWANTGGNANGLGVAPGGTHAYAFVRSGSPYNGITSILRYTAATGRFETIPNTSFSTALGGPLIAGAVDPASGRYDVGGFEWVREGWTTSWVLRFRLYSFDPATQRLTSIGFFQTSVRVTALTTPPSMAGDMAFDAAGNLVVLGVYNQTTPYLFTVPAAAVAAATAAASAATQLPVSAPAGGSSIDRHNYGGFAIDSDGTVLLGEGSWVKRYDPATWEKINGPGSSQNGYPVNRVALKSTSTDLASCTTPPTIALRKDVRSRVAPADQFTLRLLRGTTEVGTATTAGAATGAQEQHVGPVPARAGATYSFTEAMAAGSSSPAEAYSTTYRCTANGAVIAEGTGRSGSVTIPALHAGESPAAVDCVFTNGPLEASVVVTKTWVVDGVATPHGRQPQGLDAALRLTGPADAPAADQAWGQPRGGYLAGGAVEVSESTSVAADMPGCVVASQRVTAVNGGTADAALPYRHTLGAGENRLEVTNTVTCQTRLTLVKRVEGGEADAKTWTLSAYPADGPAVVEGATGVTGTVTPDTALQLAESAGSPLYVQDDARGPEERSASPRATGSWECRALDARGETLAGVLAPRAGGAGSVSLPRGAHAECTAVNRTARLTLLKVVRNENGTGTATAADWTLSATPAAGVEGLAATSVTGAGAPAAANTFAVRPGHAYAIDESGRIGENGREIGGYLRVAVERFTGEDPSAPGALDDPANWAPVEDPADVRVAAGGHGVYRFVNEDAPALVLPLTGGPGRDGLPFGGLALILLLAAGWVGARAVRRTRRESDARPS